MQAVSYTLEKPNPSWILTKRGSRYFTKKDKQYLEIVNHYTKWTPVNN